MFSLRRFGLTSNGCPGRACAKREQNRTSARLAPCCPFLNILSQNFNQESSTISKEIVDTTGCAFRTLLIPGYVNKPETLHGLTYSNACAGRPPLPLHRLCINIRVGFHRHSLQFIPLVYRNSGSKDPSDSSLWDLTSPLFRHFTP